MSMALDMGLFRPKRVSGRAYTEALLSRGTIAQARATLSMRTPLTGTERNIILNEPRMIVQNRGGGWVRVTYRDVYAGESVTFNIRKTAYLEAMSKGGRFYDPLQGVYSRWINTTRQGYMYSQRRQVEGMLKVAKIKGDMALVSELERILMMSDEKVARFREEWEKIHSETEIEEFYEYDEFSGDGLTVWN